jgi:hypothetical protein
MTKITESSIHSWREGSAKDGWQKEITIPNRLDNSTVCYFLHSYFLYPVSLQMGKAYRKIFIWLASNLTLFME